LRCRLRERACPLGQGRAIASQEAALLSSRARFRLGIDGRVTSAPYSILEILKRLDDVDRPRADELLPLVIEGVIGSQQVLAAYNEVANRAEGKLDASKAGKRAGVRFTERCRGIALRHSEKFTSREGCHVVEGARPLRHITPDVIFVALDGDSVQFVDAVDAKYLARKPSPAAIRSILHEAIFSAQFFRRYWILLPSTCGVESVLASDLDDLDYQAIGIAVVNMGDGPEYRIVRKAEADTDNGAERATNLRQKRELLESDLRSWLLPAGTRSDRCDAQATSRQTRV
jgi:hypothetical protein